MIFKEDRFARARSEYQGTYGNESLSDVNSRNN